MVMNPNFYCVAFKKLKKTHQETHFLEKKQNERTLVTTFQIGLNGIGLSKRLIGLNGTGLSKTNRIACYI